MRASLCAQRTPRQRSTPAAVRCAGTGCTDNETIGRRIEATGSRGRLPPSRRPRRRHTSVPPADVAGPSPSAVPPPRRGCGPFRGRATTARGRVGHGACQRWSRAASAMRVNARCSTSASSSERWAAKCSPTPRRCVGAVRRSVCTPLGGELRERAAAILRARGPADQPGSFHPVDQPRQAALGQQHLSGEFLHPQAVLIGLVQVDEHVVPGQRDALFLAQFPLERSVVRACASRKARHACS
jgi:hypothetical protein